MKAQTGRRRDKQQEPVLVSTPKLVVSGYMCVPFDCRLVFYVQLQLRVCDQCVFSCVFGAWKYTLSERTLQVWLMLSRR